MIVDRSDQIWEYRDRHDRFVIAWVHAPVDEMGHAVTVFFSTEPRIWGLGAQRWAECPLDLWDADESFSRLL